ncbi:PRC-barrel domain containing protein [Paracoccus sp. p4-l81]|uniref:PRC-barrel domain containing protein n=1 Tax=Paracoccus sp. p4-l81 TaxID=3342806 RepID=UPI0035B9D719
MDHSKHARLTDADFTDTTLSGATVYGPGDERIGHVSEVLGRGADCRVVVDVGGFLGLGAKPVAVNARELDFMRDSSNSVHAVTT